jgi:hypothetical protein
MTGRLRALDGLRGLLALYILAGHTAPFLRVPASAAWVGSILSHGRAAVELFFVLSGMVILRSLGTGFSRVSAGQFLRARAGRLLPVYAIALAAAALALSCGDPFRALPWLAANDAAHDIAEAVWPQPWLAHLAAHITLTQGILPAAVLPNAEFTILGPAWSLSTEWQFYLVVAAILAVRQTRHAGADGWRVFAGAMMAVGVIGLLVDLLPADWQPGRAFLPHEAWYFALGIASHGLLTSGGTSATRLDGLGGAAALDRLPDLRSIRDTLAAAPAGGGAECRAHAMARPHLLSALSHPHAGAAAPDAGDCTGGPRPCRRLHAALGSNRHPHAADRRLRAASVGGSAMLAMEPQPGKAERQALLFAKRSKNSHHPTGVG